VAAAVASRSGGDPAALLPARPDRWNGVGGNGALPLDRPVVCRVGPADAEPRARRDIAALALVASFAAQAVVERREGSHRRDQGIGCVLLALGLAGLVAAAPTGSLALLVTGAAVAGVGHGIAFLTAQQELNELAPGDRRGEVTAAFIACIYFLVASFVITSGLLGSVFSLSASVEAVGSALLAVALVAAAWQAAGASPRSAAPRRRAGAPRSAAARR
jgi:MFS family permease